MATWPRTPGPPSSRCAAASSPTRRWADPRGKRDPPGGARRLGHLPRHQAGRAGRGTLRVRRDPGRGDRLRRAALAGLGQQVRLLPGLGGRPPGRHGRRVRQEDRGWHVISMWVSPQARGGGLADRLIGAVAGYARDQHAPTLTLWVTDG